MIRVHYKKNLGFCQRQSVWDYTHVPPISLINHWSLSLCGHERTTAWPWSRPQIIPKLIQDEMRNYPKLWLETLLRKMWIALQSGTPVYIFWMHFQSCFDFCRKCRKSWECITLEQTAAAADSGIIPVQELNRSSVAHWCESLFNDVCLCKWYFKSCFSFQLKLYKFKRNHFNFITLSSERKDFQNSCWEVVKWSHWESKLFLNTSKKACHHSTNDCRWEVGEITQGREVKQFAKWETSGRSVQLKLSIAMFELKRQQDTLCLDCSVVSLTVMPHNIMITRIAHLICSHVYVYWPDLRHILTVRFPS